MIRDKFIGLNLVTIIIPTIGRPHYIIDSVRSALDQSYANLEIIISENDTQIKTQDLLSSSSISDPRIRIISTNKRLDFAEHMNFCINEAKGYYVMILSDDDQMSSGYVEEMAGLLDSDSLVVVSLGRQVYISGNDKGRIPNSAVEESTAVYAGIEFLKRQLAGSVPQIATYVSLFAKKEEVLRMGGFKPYPYGAHSDNYLFFKLALHGKVALGKNKFFYRVYSESVGLGMPFPSLLTATKKYTRDIVLEIKKLYNLGKITKLDKKLLSNLIKSQNSGMLLGRLIRLYRKRVSFLKFLYYIILSIIFRI